MVLSLSGMGAIKNAGDWSMRCRHEKSDAGNAVCHGLPGVLAGRLAADAVEMSATELGEWGDYFRMQSFSDVWMDAQFASLKALIREWCPRQQ